MFTGTTTAELFHYIAPNYCWQSMYQHLRQKFYQQSAMLFEQQFNEFLKFIFLRSCYGKGFIPVAHEIDEFWHEFILQTREYASFCMSLPGQHFIHHNSVTLGEYAKQEDRDEIVRNLLDWIPRYIQHFGDFTTETANWWMIVQFLQNEMQLSLMEINLLS